MTRNLVLSLHLGRSTHPYVNVSFLNPPDDKRHMWLQKSANEEKINRQAIKFHEAKRPASANPIIHNIHQTPGERANGLAMFHFPKQVIRSSQRLFSNYA